jgi:succinoglycan biosynthesis transport protein ExoP
MKAEDLPVIPKTTDRAGDMTIEAYPMSQAEYGSPEPPQSSLNFHDIIFILFRHKWKIIICAMLGILAAAGVYFFLPAQYESQSKLFVRYVMDRSAVDGLDSQTKTLGSPSESAINSEVEILTSSDLAMQVAAAVGADRLVQRSRDKVTNADAGLSIVRNLDVSVVKDSNIISVTYRNSDPRLAVEVLQELVKRYFDKHLEVHRSLGAFDFVTREADQLRAQLNQTEEELKQLKTKTGITSLAEDTTALATELAKVQEDLDGAEAELAAQKARVNEIEKSLAGADAQQSEQVARPPSSDVVGEYQGLVTRVAHLREMETELLSKYTAQNRIVEVKRALIDDLEKQRRDLEKKHPGLLGTIAAVGASQSSRPDIMSERARLTGLQARTETLRSRLASLQEKANMLSEMGPKIAQLERKKEVEETNYKYYGASLEKARIDETLDPSRMPNISIVQAPSPAGKAKRDLKKVIPGLAGGGLALGLALALLIELVLDRTIKRPFELERRLRIPLLLSIPNFGSNGHRLRLYDAGANSETAIAQSTGSGAETGELLRPFCEAIRDRLGLYFEMNRMTHKPKLVAVTGLSKNAGTSTLATGLAATLSDTGDGKVLLVDKPVSPKRFYNMMSEFKASDLDYVIFDMPSIGDTSSTLPMAGFMDKVLLVVEAEKSSRETIKRAYSQLAAKVDVSVIFNKSRSYGPKWLAEDF